MVNDTTNLVNQYGDIAEDITTGNLKAYINFQLLHNNSLKKVLRDIKSFPIIMMENINEEYQIFFKKLIKYEKEHEYDYTGNGKTKKKYKSIYAVKLEILLPRKIKTKKQIKYFIRKFMLNLNPLGYKLPYLAYEVHRGDATYINILLSERQCFDHSEYVRYNRNYADKQGRITHKKGDLKLDAKGKKIKIYVQFSSKVRIFVLNRPFEHFMKILFQYFKIAVRKIVRDIKIQFFIQIKKARGSWHYFNRQCILEINNAKRYIEYMCNYAVDLQRETVIDYIMDEHIRSVPTPRYKEIQAIFMKYKKRFDKESYHDSTNTLRLIQYKGVPLNTLKRNIKDLIYMFEIEIKNIVPKIVTV